MRFTLGQKGFTIIEILIAMFVLGFGILGVASLQVSSTRGNAVGNRITQATTLAVERLETLKSLPYNHSDLRDDPLSTGQNLATAGLLQAGSGSDHSATRNNYTIYWNVAVDNPADGVKTVTVIVVPQIVGSQRPVTLTTVIPEIS